MNFLQQVATYLFEKFEGRFGNVEIIFPGKRARLFFNEHLCELSEKPIWAPAYYSINEFIEELSGMQIADNFTLLFELFDVYKEVTKSHESFDDFYFYAEMLLSDFDDIDKYLRDPKDVFKNLSELKNLENYYEYLNENQINAIKKFWNTFDPQNMSDDQKDFIFIWEALEVIYKKFNSSLTGKHIAYEGMAYRKVVEKIKNEGLRRNTIIVFVGFNALNKCEKILFTNALNAGYGLFFWDFDDYYINNGYHQAGRFIKENKKVFPAPVDFKSETNNFTKKNNIRFIAAPSNIIQVKAIDHCLNELNLKTEFDYNKTAIVLADEQLLIPVLYSLPDHLKNFNVSMGYPFNKTPVYGLIEILIDLQKNCKEKNSEVLYYYKDVLSIVNHQYLSNNFNDLYKVINEKIFSGNKIYLKRYELTDIKMKDSDPDFFNNIFIKVDKPLAITEYLITVIKQILYHSMNQGKNKKEIKIEREFLHFAIISLTRINEILINTKVDISYSTIFRIIRKVIQSASIPFTGEPLSGIQIMGILETRTIDFENVIILSLNEGVFPKISNVPSFIPPNLRYGFELPTMEDHDAIFAYYFYRLLQKAKNCFLIYNTFHDGFFTGERSRFLHQLAYETDFNIKSFHIDYNIQTSASKKIIVKKSPEIMRVLNKYLENGNEFLSPSAINSYINCSLRFYFRYIEGLKEPDEIMEEIDPAVFGNILHKVLNNLYKPYNGKDVSPEIINSILKKKNDIERNIKNVILKEFYKSDLQKENITGKNLIIQDMIMKYVLQILEIDKKYTPFHIYSLEYPYNTQIEIEIDNKKSNVVIGGIIDRVDIIDNSYRIIDYKTGKEQQGFKNIEDLFDEDSSKRNNSVFQVFLYGLMFLNKVPNAKILPGLYFTQNIFDINFDYHIKAGRIKVLDFNEYKEQYKNKLIETLNKLFHKDIHFIQTDDIKYCEYCPYANFCKR